MDHQSADKIHITLIHHLLVSCAAGVQIKPAANSGGTVEFTSTVEAPDNKTVIKNGELYSINLLLECIGKTTETQDIAFRVSCKMEGICEIFSVSAGGVKSTANLWAQPANQLFPLVSQFVSDLVSRMGYKNVVFPLSMPQTSQLVETKKAKTQ